MKRLLTVLIAGGLLATALGGCIVVPPVGGGPYYHGGYYRGGYYGPGPGYYRR